jgi:hypothetical protein
VLTHSWVASSAGSMLFRLREAVQNVLIGYYKARPSRLRVLHVKDNIIICKVKLIPDFHFTLHFRPKLLSERSFNNPNSIRFIFRFSIVAVNCMFSFYTKTFIVTISFLNERNEIVSVTSFTTGAVQVSKKCNCRCQLFDEDINIPIMHKTKTN